MIIKVENGCFTYKHGRRQVLDNINFEASAGDVVAILGPNGAGKTTLLRCTMGFLKWSSGRSLLESKDFRNLPGKELWKTLSYVPQAKQVSSAYTVREMVLLGRSVEIGVFSLPSKEDVRKADAVIEKLGLSRIADSKCSEISGGELQMVLIARALVSEPKVLILDEPESNLDFKNQLLVLDTITELAASGVCCIFNTHYPSHALRRANKTLMLSPGGSHLFGNTRDIITEENIEKVFGVHAVIGDIESEEKIFQDVVAVGIKADSDQTQTKGSFGSAVATVSIIVSDTSIVTDVNSILHRYSKYIIGRMGMPYKKAGFNMINIFLDAPVTEIRALTDKLNLLPEISVKTTYGKELNQHR